MRIQNRSPFRPRAKGAYDIENKADELTLYVYDEISWFGVSAEKFIQDLNSSAAKTIHIRFNSPGGSVFDGTAMFNAIKSHKSKTVAHIDGLAASISSVIALAADEILMSQNAFFMIHEPWSLIIGNADMMREEAELLDKVGGVIAKTYMDKTGKSEADIKALMTAETWMTADEAKAMGFIDMVENGKEEKACATLFDLSVFANVPEKLMEQKNDLTERGLERALRDAGCSRNQAKEILAKGFVIQDEREAQNEDENHLREAETATPKNKDDVMDLLVRIKQTIKSTDK